jgi:hypothetical protein
MTDIETGRDKKPGFLDKHPWVLLAVLGLYVALLALGTVGEVFHIDWILDLPIYKGP